MSSKMSKRRLCSTCAAGTLLIAIGMQAFAADPALERKPLSWHLDAGYVLTDDSTSDFLEDGWMLEGGVTWRPEGGPIALRADLRYLGFDVDDDVVSLGGTPAVPASVDDGDAAIFGLNLGASYNFEFAATGSGYLTVGLGPYYRDVELTQTLLVPGIACEPFFGICFNALAPSEVVVADSETTRLGWSAALGIEYPFREGAVFLEARYLRIETERPTELVPIQIGFRF
jgi:hypothetical protein